MRKHIAIVAPLTAGGMPTASVPWACKRPATAHAHADSGPPQGGQAVGMPPVLCLLVVAAVAFVTASAWAVDPPAGVSNPQSAIRNPQSEEKVRELFVPFEDLSVLLEGKTQRVLLTREQYRDLQARAKKTAEGRPPRDVLLASADYAARIENERAVITATLAVSVLEDGLHAVGLDIAGVGLRAAALDGKGAPIGLADDGRFTLFVEGKGEHKLLLEMVAPLKTTAATQVLNFRLPAPPTARLALTAPGDVEVKSGAAVMRRVFDEAAGVTRIDLAPPKGDASIVLSLNSRLKRQDRVVVARSVLVDEITSGYERLHATVSLAILHQPTDRFRFALPNGFEATSVESPLLARWGVTAEGGRRIIDVQLREETAEKVVLAISAVRSAANLEAWSFPRLEPLDVAGQAAVVGLLLEDRLKAEGVATDGLIPIDTPVLAQALPATVLAAEPGAVRIRPVVAYYAPQGTFSLAARFTKPPAKVLVTTSVLVVLEDGGQTVRGGFAMMPEAEKLFGFDFSVPAGWDVTGVTDQDDKALPFERYGEVRLGGRVHVRLPSGLVPGQERRVYFTATCTPKDWFGEWTRTDLEFPQFAVQGAARDIGAIAVDARDDMTVRPESLERLTPLAENEKKNYGLGGVEAALAYRYEARPYQARLVVERKSPRATAQTYSFFRVDRDALVAHYELAFDVTEARTRRLALLLPKDTPPAVAIRGLDDVKLKEFTSDLVGAAGAEKRRWTAVLADGRMGSIRLAVDFETRLAAAEIKDLALPVVVADGVAYQSGLVAVEGSAERDVQVASATSVRKVDVGELAAAEYQPGRRLLGAYGFLGEPPAVKISVARPPAYFLPPAIVQRAELASALSAGGRIQTAARFLLRTKALFLEIRLPAGSRLWAATLDGRPIKPQREGESLLVSLPAGADDAPGKAAGEAAARDLTVVYEGSVAELGLWSSPEATAPRLLLHGGRKEEAVEVPLADLVWQVYLPTGYRVIRSEGSVATDEIVQPELAAASLAGGLWYAGGGVDFDHGAIGGTLALLSMSGMRAMKSTQTQTNLWSVAKSAEDVSERSLESRNLRDARVGGEQPVVLAALPPPADAPAPGETPPAPDSAPGEKMVPLNIPLPKAMFAGTPKALPHGATKAEGPQGPATPAKKPAEQKKSKSWALEGVASLRIDLERTGRAVTFRSLGAEPRLGLVVTNDRRLDSLAWGLALAVLLVGMAMTTQPVGRKIAFIIGAALVATLVPVITGRIELALVTNGMFYAACLLIPYYLVAGAARWLAQKFRGMPMSAAVATVAVIVVVGTILLMGTVAALAAEPAMPPYVIQLAPPPEPVNVPDDAILLPYDPASKGGVQAADRLLIPYDRYVELWNLAYPDKPIGAKEPPAPYAPAGASLAAVLKGEEYLLFEGYIYIDVYAEGYVTVPLPLAGGVLAKADLDGKPARLAVVQAEPMPAPSSPDRKVGGTPQGANSAPAQDARGLTPAARPPSSFVVAYVSGKGRHRLDLVVRMKLEKRGGWRVAEGRLPAAPATALAIRVPEAGTEVRLGGVADRSAYETKAADETIATAVGAAGAISIQWRPKVAEGQVDLTLTADSAADLQVQEDQLRLRWTLALEFRRGEREFFSVEVPEGYLVEKVEGSNVRGWELKPSGARQQVEVMLLKRTRERESFTLTLWRPSLRPAAGAPAEAAAAGKPVEFDVPAVGVVGAIRHTGRLTIRRSPMLDLRTVAAEGVTRTDLAPEARRGGAAAPAADESPLGIRPYQAYQFVAVPFKVRLAAAPVSGKATAVAQTILRVAERERKLEARVLLAIEGRPIYRVRIVVPADLVIDRVQAPGTFEWALTDDAGRKVLTIYPGAGLQREAPILIQGTLGRDVAALALDLPRLEVLDVERQEGDIVVQTDPAFEVRAEGLTNVEQILMERVFGWLAAAQRGLAQLALHYGRPDYAGRLTLAARKPDVSCLTVTNSRVTDRTIEDAILLAWSIKSAGIREVSFLVPAWMKDARISVPMLRQKTVTPTSAEPGAPLRVRLALQDEVMGELKVLVENDRLLTDASHEAPVPVVETGRADRRYVALESAGRDEVIVVKSEGLEPLSRQQKEWAAVAGMLRGGQTTAFIVAAGTQPPKLEFRTKERAAVETAKARIGLAQTVLVIDENGAYRARQTYRIDNRTEQFLEVQLPEGAALWAVQVAGEPVKPTVLPEAVGRGRVRIPLVRTAAGDLDYPVVLKYGGKLPPLEALRPSVEFPLIRTVNINVELSQVELHVPKTLQWTWWRGSMHEAAAEGEFEAGVMAYQNRLAEGLVQTLRFGNPFEQARAASNYKSLSLEMQKNKEAAAAYSYNKGLQIEVGNTTVILQQADKEIQAQSNQGAVVQIDNNDSLRNEYGGQRNVRSNNLVVTLGANWTGAAPPAQPQAGSDVAAGDGRFNSNWLASNSLENPALQAEAGKKLVKDQKGELNNRLDMGGQMQAAQPKAPVMNQPAAPEVGQQQAGGRGKFRPEPGSIVRLYTQQPAEPQAAQAQQGQGAQMPQRGGQQQEDVVQRYQQKLQQRAEMDRKVTTEQLEVIGVGGGGREIGGVEGLGSRRRASYVAAGEAAAAAPAPTGLASLDVDLPLRGTMVRFTTPRGDVEIRATAVSQPLIDGLVRLGAAVGLVVLVLVVRRLARRGSFGFAAQRTCSTVLLVLGVLGVMFGVFPVAGVAAIFAGIGMKLWLRFARRRAAAAA